MNLNVNIEEMEKGYVFIKLSGDMDAYTSKSFKEIVESLMHQRKYKLVIDMENVTCLDSIGARGLLATLSKTRENDGDLWLIYETSPVKRFLDVTGLNDNFTIFKDASQAFKTLALTYTQTCGA